MPKCFRRLRLVSILNATVAVPPPVQSTAKATVITKRLTRLALPRKPPTRRLRRPRIPRTTLAATRTQESGRYTLDIKMGIIPDIIKFLRRLTATTATTADTLMTFTLARLG